MVSGFLTKSRLLRDPGFVGGRAYVVQCGVWAGVVPAIRMVVAEASHGCASPICVPPVAPQPRRPLSFGTPPEGMASPTSADQSLTLMTASANACGASRGRLCPTPPWTVRWAYLPENLLA